ncbi:MAG: NAD(P)/FAD-dependent oxidoreductase [Tenuifilaceae bacterium]
MKKNYDIAIIGAGPAGLIAAGRSASLGASVILLEKMEKPARKLRITGKGRCNITNMKPLEDYLKEIYPEPRFLRQAFSSFFNNDIIELLHQNGVETKTERGERVFPASDKARDVADALVRWAKHKGVEIQNFAQVEEIILEDKTIQGLSIRNTKSNQVETISVKSVIIATGGKSYPATGSTGDGYIYAEKLGHKIETLRPSLVGIETNPTYQSAKGLSLRNVQITLWIDGKKNSSDFGEAEFTEYGLDGPIILKLSRKIIDFKTAGKKVELTLDLKPALDHQKLEARLTREIQELGKKDFKSLLKLLLPAPLVDVFIKNLGIDQNKSVTQISGSERKKLINLLKEMRIEVIGFRGWNEAIITAGGVSIKEINPKTMESKIINNLYFAGEVIDVDGNTGGYNLQIAFSTGWLAGDSAARKLAETT